MKRSLFNLIAGVGMTLASLAAANAQVVAIRTLAGTATPGATNGFGSNARFNHPSAIAADAAGNVYIADTENGTIRKISSDGFVSTFAGLAGNYGSADGGGATARFFGPEGIVADNSGQVFVADTANSTIRKITAAGVVSTFAGAAGVSNSLDGAAANARFFHPEGLALDAGGNLYVADTWNHTIRRITPGGIVTTLAGSAGNYGCADGTNSKARFNRPCGIGVDGAANLYVADSLNHIIRKITPAGNVSTIAGLAGIWGSADGTNSAARFYLPQGISVSATGELFVGDSGNQTLRKISPSGTNWVVSTVAGLTGQAGSLNAVGTSAQFYFPSGIALDNAGYLYVADMANNEARTTRIVAPTLQYRLAGTNFVLSWPVSSEGFTLEQSATLGPTAAWSSAMNGVFTSGDNFARTNSSIGTAFYRLRLP
jgi:sugar lactone lactonase YvrE